MGGLLFIPNNQGHAVVVVADALLEVTFIVINIFANL
jgi:hypothetical protein